DPSELHLRDAAGFKAAMQQAIDTARPVDDVLKEITAKDGEEAGVDDDILMVRPWPTLHQAAMHGIAGEFVRAVDPHTEADPVAVLLHGLVMFGNGIGRNPHCRVGVTRHALNEFLVVVGRTGKARKGTAYDLAEDLFRRVLAAWVSTCIKSGASTREGLIYHVRDANPEKEDPGVVDK